MRPDKKNHSKNILSKKCFTLLLSLLTIFSLITGSACNPTKTVTYYPEPETGDPSDEIAEDIPEETDAGESIDPQTALFSEYDSIREEGTFVYNPTSINAYFKDELKDNPKIALIAKKILRSVYDLETEFELKGSYKCDKAEFVQAAMLAAYSSPFISCVDFKTDDYETITVEYFPNYSETEDGIKIAETKFREYEDFVTVTVNDVVSADDDDMQRAYKIYKYMIEEFEMDYPEKPETLMRRNDNLVEPGNFDVYAIIDLPETGKLPVFEFVVVYQFFLTQLNIKHMSIGGGGYYNEQECETINEYMTFNSYHWWIWDLVFYDDKYYNCDIVMDKMTLDYQRENDEERESEMVYFGMSDKKRKESVNYQNRGISQTTNPVAQLNTSAKIPACAEDYK